MLLVHGMRAFAHPTSPIDATKPPSPMNDIAVKVRNVSHQFGEQGESLHVRALLDTSLDIARGELLCLIGPSGCGKSTLLNVIGGLLEPTTGTVHVGNTQVKGPLPQQVAYVFQENALFPWSTVIQNVKLGMMFQGVARTERAQIADRRGSSGFCRSLSGAALRRHAPACRARTGLEP